MKMMAMLLHMNHKGLIFIPDISGFTKFVHAVELKHSQHIIMELIETLIDANEMGLNVSEIEGDAILFYKFGETPDLNVTYKQVQKMFLAFHKRLEVYESLRTCHCNACISAINLSLKVISHYGEFAEFKVKDFATLIGKDIIIAHQLLKNDIPKHEYWLITSNLSEGKSPQNFTSLIEWAEGSKKLDEDEISYHFTQLGHLLNDRDRTTFTNG
jgi:predicted nucleic-acid-binding protein